MLNFIQNEDFFDGVEKTRSQLKSGGRTHGRLVVSFEHRQREGVKVTREKYVFIYLPPPRVSQYLIVCNVA